MPLVAGPNMAAALADREQNTPLAFGLYAGRQPDDIRETFQPDWPAHYVIGQAFMIGKPPLMPDEVGR